MQCEKDTTSLDIQVDKQINPGTSGSPVINDFGEILGIVSHPTIKDSGNTICEGLIPRPHLSLPVWVYQRIINEY